MTLVITGVSYKTMPTDRLGGFRVNADNLDKSLMSLSGPYSGMIILSTCNRTEIYADAEGEAATQERMRALLNKLPSNGGTLKDGEEYFHAGVDTISHLTRVATGLDSAIVGEPHIVGQISDAFACSVDLGASSPSLTELFHHAIRANRRIRRRAGMNAKRPSIASLAITAAGDMANGYRGKSVLTVGAGEIGAEIALGIQDKGADAHLIVSRTFEKAKVLSARTGALPVAISQMSELLMATDIVFTCTSADFPVLTRELLEQIMRARNGLPMVIVDLAVPGDVEPGSGEIEGINLVSIDELQKSSRRQQLPAEIIDLANELVIQETAKFKSPDETGHSGAFVRELAMFAENIRRSELIRTETRLASLEPQQRQAIELMTKSIIKRILAGPIRYAKQYSDQESIQMAAQSFGIDTTQLTDEYLAA